jgi:YbbR domain-containing protein
MYIEVRLRYMIDGIVIDPGDSVTFHIERPPLVAGYIYVDVIGASVGRFRGMRAINPLPPGVTYSLDPSNNTITITNNTSNRVTISVAYIVDGYWFRLK